MSKKRCSACGRFFQTRPQVPHQSYCSSPGCQRERRREWQHIKLQSDPDYQDNQSRAQQAWSQRNPNYWRDYREAHPAYVVRNRALQQGRNAKSSASSIAKMDASNPSFPLPSGLYRLSLVPDVQIAKMDLSIPTTRLPSGIYSLSLVTDAGIAKMDAWTVEITVHACECGPRVAIAKR